ncbi:hypothetical protein LAUMK4_05143 [Mycobacterium persicum]|uniref:Uncharacterized protein n=1 Tax=Mycobacterium persicum TaxID=1487726 RepID=A0ABY6RQJ7_9MYCO|nr:hypothetical protein [Mycobacterium persicum]VAZ80772.1 hypothetical protein LAUMK15_05541 [Mycobacterium persicum]VBA30569.1 hypothetical protein LAUMK4_05143 [Mycobacterium persicum]
MGAATEHDWIKEGLLIAGLQDWISLSEVHSSFLTNTGPRRPVHEVQQLTLSMIRELVSEGLCVLGTAAGSKRNPHLEPCRRTSFIVDVAGGCGGEFRSRLLHPRRALDSGRGDPALEPMTTAWLASHVEPTPVGAPLPASLPAKATHQPASACRPAPLA